MKMKDAKKLMKAASLARVPWMAWALHMRCAPNMLQDKSNWGCGVGMKLKVRLIRGSGEGTVRARLGSGLWRAEAPPRALRRCARACTVHAASQPLPPTLPPINAAARRS
jgi:hypothetical protein